MRMILQLDPHYDKNYLFLKVRDSETRDLISFKRIDTGEFRSYHSSIIPICNEYISNEEIAIFYVLIEIDDFYKKVYYTLNYNGQLKFLYNSVEGLYKDFDFKYEFCKSISIKKICRTIDSVISKMKSLQIVVHLCYIYFRNQHSAIVYYEDRSDIYYCNISETLSPGAPKVLNVELTIADKTCEYHKITDIGNYTYLHSSRPDQIQILDKNKLTPISKGYFKHQLVSFLNENNFITSNYKDLYLIDTTNIKNLRVRIIKKYSELSRSKAKVDTYKIFHMPKYFADKFLREIKDILHDIPSDLINIVLNYFNL